MFSSPQIILFYLTILVSIILVCSSNSLFLSWIGLEINTLTFLPIIVSFKNKEQTEASVKYFLTQTLASILFLIALIFSNKIESWSLIITLSLVIKLGAAPFHSWVPSVAASLPWLTTYVLLTIQKINPLLILLDTYNNLLLTSIMIISLIMGALIGLSQVSLRALLVFSSINHLGWLASCILIKKSLTPVYFFIYMFLLISVILILNKWNLNFINQINNLVTPSFNQMILFFSLLSLGGLPPFLGFFPKWLILQMTVNNFQIIISGVMILMSLLTLFFYLRISFSSFLLKQSTFLKKNVMFPLNLLTMLNLLNMFGLPFMCLWP